MKKRKNILLIITDQQRSTDFWGENWAWDNLPAMKRLMRYGMNFRNAFCNTCMCSPSRSTLFTGLYPARHGVTRTLSFGGQYSPNEPTLSAEIPNLARIMFKAGYRVEYRGKWHLNKGNFKGDTKNDLTASEVGLFGFQGWVPPDAGEDAEPENFGAGWAQHDQRYVDETRDWIAAHKDDEQPWFMVLSLVNPHDVLGYPGTWRYGFRRADWQRKDNIPLPGTLNEDLRTNHKPTAQAQLLANLNYLLGELKDEAMQQNYLNFYANLQEYVDKQTNEVIDLFFDENDQPNSLFNDTVIVRTSDHGEMGLAHGGLRQKAFNAYEESIRIPLIWSNPELFPEKQDSEAMVSLVDMVPTFMSMFGIPWDVVAEDLDREIEPGRYFSGVDFSPVLNGSASSVQDDIIFTFDDTRAGSPSIRRPIQAADRIRMIRTERYKLAWYFQENSSYPEEFEFYDLSVKQEEKWGNDVEFANLAYGKPDDYPQDKYDEAMAALPGLVKRLKEGLLNKVNLLDQDPANPPKPTPLQAMLGINLGK